jgi:hypothetical protein
VSIFEKKCSNLIDRNWRNQKYYRLIFYSVKGEKVTEKLDIGIIRVGRVRERARKWPVFEL